jgi:hypothetical protein
MIKVKAADQILPIKNGTALLSPSPATFWALFVTVLSILDKRQVTFDLLCDLHLNVSECG